MNKPFISALQVAVAVILLLTVSGCSDLQPYVDSFSRFIDRIMVSGQNQEPQVDQGASFDVPSN